MESGRTLEDATPQSQMQKCKLSESFSIHIYTELEPVS